jgi:hypothetical protein
MWRRLVKWLLFTVIISLLPFIFTGVDLWTDGKLDHLLLMYRHGELLWPHGELLLVSIAIVADAAGGLIASGTTDRVDKLLLAGGAVILAIGAAAWYEKIQQPGAHVLIRIVDGSAVVFTVSILIGLITSALLEN